MQKTKVKSQKFLKNNGFTVFQKVKINNGFMFSRSEKTNPLAQSFTRGFTLIEILVVTAILGLLLTLAANVIITILRNQNKANLVSEIRQNADLAINTFERDVRSAKDANVVDSTHLTLTLPDDTPIVWACSAPSAGSNGTITRQVNGGFVVPVTNTDTSNGVSVISCTFKGDTSTGLGSSALISFDFKMHQGVTNPSNSVEFNTSDIEFSTSVGPRALPR